MANQSPRPILPINVPVNYPTVPTPGKIQTLFAANKRDLYHKLSPYGYDTFFGIKTRQPFIYTYPDEVNKTNPNNLFIVDLYNRSITDVKRVAKFMGSQNGILFIGKQFLLQTGNAFNETRIWNPTSPIVAAGMGLNLWAVRPQRNVDTSDLLGSLLGSLGSGIRSIFTNSPPKPPAGTMGAKALPTNNSTGGKGLLRGGTADAALIQLNQKWTVPSTKGLGFAGAVGSFLRTTFGNFIPKTQTGARRADEATYGLMLGSGTGETGTFTYLGANGEVIGGVQQLWFGGTVQIMRRSLTGPPPKPLNWTRMFMLPNARTTFIAPSLNDSIQGQSVGYELIDNSKPVKYGNYVGTSQDQTLEGGSDVLIQQTMYLDQNNKYASKFTNKQDPQVRNMREAMEKVLKQIEASKIYKVDPTFRGTVVSFNHATFGYDRIAARTPSSPKYTVLDDYRSRNVRVLENQNSSDPARRSKKMASTRQFDGLNTLTVLNKSRAIDNGLIPGWTEWRPYEDDQIAFYFYDVVNEKYIPFRAIIRGLQETDSANWEELSFLGRADRLYSYSGFNRSLTFNFTVHISSLVELAPTWQRINYLMSMVKPANYTTPSRTASGLYTRFMVPPMVMVTIGDMYKNQPIILASAGITIPDTATWETLNSANSTEWAYLADSIKAPKIEKRYGQLPLTAEISINAYILEQERAITGASHFGRAPHTEQYEEGEYKTTLPDNELPSDLHKSMVVYQSVTPPRRTQGRSRTGTPYGPERP